MTDRTDVEAFRRNSLELSARAQAQIERLVRSVDLTADPGDVVATLLEFLPDVVQTYGEAAAAVAADYYETLREAALGAEAAFATPLAEAAPLEQISASTRWASSPLFVDGPIDEAALLGRLKKVTDRLVKKPGRATLEDAIRTDPSTPRFARIPTGRVTCVFCAMLASRGAVYVTRETAGALSDFHDHCDCAITPIFAGQALPAGYNPDHYFKIYQDNGGAGIDLRDRKTRSVTAADAPASPEGSRKQEPLGVLALPRRVAGVGKPSNRPLTELAREVNPTGNGINCPACVVALEMRARGIPVTALPSDEALLGPQDVAALWRTGDGVAPTWEIAESFPALLRTAEGWGEGARGVICVELRSAMNSHAFNVEVRGGHAVFADGQGFFPLEDWPSAVFWDDGVRLLRVDDLDFSDQAADLVTRDSVDP